MPPKIPSLSPAADDLGLGDLLTGQVADETDEVRKKRMQQRQLMASGGSLAAMSLFGGMGGGTRT